MTESSLLFTFAITDESFLSHPFFLLLQLIQDYFVSTLFLDGKLYSLYTTDTKDQWSSYADDSFQSDSSFAYADDTYDYLSTNYRASLGCISELPTVTVLPSLMQSRNFQFSQNDSTLDVRFERKLFKDDLYGNYFTLMFYFHWESVPILDPMVILNSSAPIQVRKNGVLRWTKLSNHEYQDKVRNSLYYYKTK